MLGNLDALIKAIEQQHGLFHTTAGGELMGQALISEPIASLPIWSLAETESSDSNTNTVVLKNLLALISTYEISERQQKYQLVARLSF
ncbi:MAG: hypothetical protein ACK5ZD_10140 [Hyphomonadaceae bacterium]